MNWTNYLRDIAGPDRQVDIAKKSDVDQGTVSRWFKGSTPTSPLSVARVARAYDRPVTEAFVAAGYLTEQEARVQPAARPSLDDLSDADLLSEVRKRMEARHDRQDEESGQEAGSTLHSGEDRPEDGSTTRRRTPTMSELERKQAERARRQAENDRRDLSDLTDYAADEGPFMDGDE